MSTIVRAGLGYGAKERADAHISASGFPPRNVLPTKGGRISSLNPRHGVRPRRRSSAPWYPAPRPPAGPGTPPPSACAEPAGSSGRRSGARRGNDGRRCAGVIVPDRAQHDAPHLHDPLKQPSLPCQRQRVPAPQIPPPSVPSNRKNRQRRSPCGERDALCFEAKKGGSSTPSRGKAGPKPAPHTVKKSISARNRIPPSAFHACEATNRSHLGAGHGVRRPLSSRCS